MKIMTQVSRYYEEMGNLDEESTHTSGSQEAGTSDASSTDASVDEKTRILQYVQNVFVSTEARSLMKHIRLVSQNWYRE